MKRRLSILLLTGLTACGSPAPFTYTLSQQSSRTVPLLIGAEKVGAYALADITVPAEVDQSALVVQQADGRVLMLAQDRWSAPLSSQLQTALSLELTSRLGMPPVQNLIAGGRDPKVTLVQVDIQRFEMVPGQFVSIHALWRIRFAGNEQVLTCFAKLQESVAIGVAALVTGQQKNTLMLSGMIAESLVARRGPVQAVCTQS